MHRPRGHVERGGNEEHIRLHAVHEVGKADIEADAYARPAEGRIEHGRRIARGERFGLKEPLTALDVDIEKMRLAVLGDKFAAFPEYERGVVDPASVRLGHASAYDDRVPLCGDR